MSNSKASTAALVILGILVVGAGVAFELYQFGIIGNKPSVSSDKTRERSRSSLLDAEIIPEAAKTVREQTTIANATPTTPQVGSADGTAQPVAATATPAQKPRAAFMEEYKAKFKPIRPGTFVLLKLKAGSTMKAIYKEIRGNNVVVACGEAEISIEKSQLAPETVALFFADDYATYMFDSETSRFMAEATRRPAQPITATPPPVTTASLPAPVVSKPVHTITTTTQPPQKKPSKVITEDWAAQEQETDLLKARQQRVKNFEEKAGKEGTIF